LVNQDSAELTPLGRFTLRPGDLLYLPRGYVHEAAANTEPALHITLGLAPYRGTQWIRECIAVWCLWLTVSEVAAALQGEPRWTSLGLLIAASIALGLSGGLRFLVKASWMSLPRRQVGFAISAMQSWLGMHVLVRVVGYWLLVVVVKIMW
jgi:hypothetical protein